MAGARGARPIGCAALALALAAGPALPAPAAGAGTVWPRAWSAPAGRGPDWTGRAATLYTSGTATSAPVSFNPLSAKAYTGSQGLLYEPLFLWDPLKDRMLPWLATGAAWLSPTEFRIDVRPGADWVDSTTAAKVGTVGTADVAYSIELARSDTADPYHPLVASVSSVTTGTNSVTVRFSAPVDYAQWQEYLWHAPVLPKAVWSALSPAQAVTDPNLAPVASGPMVLGRVDDRGACYGVNPHWWAKPALGLSFSFTRLCDMVSGPSGEQLSSLLSGRLDWSNTLLRGVANLTGTKASGYDIQTYYPSPPYMLAASTAYLAMNTSAPPTDQLGLRRALAQALDPAVVASGDYAGTVQVANPTGLLPELSGWVDARVVKRYAFHYSPGDARHELEKSGYRHQLLHLLVPGGSEDFVRAASTIASQLSAAGARLAVVVEPRGSVEAAVAAGRYQLALVMGGGLASTPWPYFSGIYAPSGGGRTEVDATAWSLLQQADHTPTSDTVALHRLYSALEQRALQQLPVVPLWYSGAWFEASTSHWSHYPVAGSRTDWYTPVMWPGWLGAATTVLALARLRPA